MSLRSSRSPSPHRWPRLAEPVPVTSTRDVVHLSCRDVQDIYLDSLALRYASVEYSRSTPARPIQDIPMYTLNSYYLPNLSRSLSYSLTSWDLNYTWFINQATKLLLHVHSQPKREIGWEFQILFNGIKIGKKTIVIYMVTTSILYNNKTENSFIY